MVDAGSAATTQLALSGGAQVGELSSGAGDPESPPDVVEAELLDDRSTRVLLLVFEHVLAVVNGRKRRRTATAAGEIRGLVYANSVSRGTARSLTILRNVQTTTPLSESTAEPLPQVGQRTDCTQSPQRPRARQPDLR